MDNLKKIIMFKVLLPLFILTLALFSCKKEVSNLEESTFLDVEEKNMGVVAKRTATWCGPCGDWGFDYFDNLKQQYGDEAVFMAFKDAFGAEGDYYFTRVNEVFGVGGGTPRFFYNFDTIHGVNYAGAGSVAQHNDSEVIANSNYEFTLTDDKINVTTTTKFFKSDQGEFLISPFLIIDNQVGYQNGNADSPNTVHPKFVANKAHPIGNEVADSWAYKVASGEVAKGYQINLEFEVNREPQWVEEDISFALILYKRVGGQYKFVNAFTK
jgi:hypothetical protein